MLVLYDMLVFLRGRCYAVKTKEIDVRLALRNDLEKEFHSDPSTIIINEMQVCCGVPRSVDR